jgi:hypothetical protein
MDLPTVVQVDLESLAWALGICGLLALLVLCATCVILSVTSHGKAPDVLTAFADVIRAFRRRPRHRGSGDVDREESALRLDRAA